MPEMNSFFQNSLWLVLITIMLSVFFLWLFIIGGSKYSMEDAESHAEHYANIIKEGHGTMTSFLWVSYAVLLIWMIYYFNLNLHQFLVIFI
jgi:heme/copper-type cytochrome/quinol oxidase subunit 2